MQTISRETDQILLNELLVRRKSASKDDLADLDNQLNKVAETGKIKNNKEMINDKKGDLKAYRRTKEEGPTKKINLDKIDKAASNDPATGYQTARCVLPSK